MAANIKLKRSAVAGRIPSADQLELGEVAINTADGKMYIKRDVNGTETVVLVNDAQEGIWKQYAYTATAGQTTFSGNDDNSQVLSYSIGYAEVYLNGILLDPAVDYTANTGYEIELTSPASLDDLIQIDSFASTIGPGDIVVNTFTGDNSTVSFTLTTDAGVEQNVSVFVDGVYQEKDTYSLSGTNLVFGEAPYTGASIEAVIGSRNITITEINDLTITGDFSAQGTISGNSFSGTSATLTGALASGSVTTGNIDSSGTIDADGDITTLTDVNANNVVATNDITATGDVEGTSLTLTGSAGAMTWNSDEETLNIPLNSDVTLQAGQENVFRIKATEAISNGEVVMFAGAQGDHILGAKADQQAVGFSPEYVIGVATQDMLINEFGFVTTFGKVRGLDTSGYSEGDILYLNPTVAGALTTTKPTPPNHVHQMAAVLSSNPAEGAILVRPTHFSDTDEIPEGLTNLYFTDARAVSAVATADPYVKNTGDTMTGDLNVVTENSSNVKIQNTTNSGQASLVFVDENDVEQTTLRYDMPGNTTRLDFNGNGFELYSNQTDSTVAKFGYGGPSYNTSYFAGDVGIGDTNPSFKLDVSYQSGDKVRFKANTGHSILEMSSIEGRDWQIESKSDGQFHIVDTDAASDRLVIDTNGNVGIGTSAPNAKLNSVGTTGTTLIQALGADSNGFADVEIKSTGTTGSSRLYFSDTAAQSGFIKYNHSGNSMEFGTAETSHVYIDSVGNFLVGMTESSVSNNGFAANASGYVTITDTSFSPLILNRKSSNGVILDLKMNELTVGSLRSRAGLVTSIVLDPRSNGSGLTGTQNAIEPTNEDGNNTDGVLSLGGATSKFNDLHMSGTIHLGDWDVTETNGNLYFAKDGVNKMKLDADGNLQVVGSIESNATIS